MAAKGSKTKIVGPVAAGPCRALAVVGTADGPRIEYVVSGGPGLPVSRLTLPMPPGGDAIALHWNGPSAVMADGSLHHWQQRQGLAGGAWHKVADLLSDAVPVPRTARPFADALDE